MAFDRLRADVEQRADLAGGVPLGDQLEDLLLALGDGPLGQTVEAVAAVEPVQVGADQGPLGAGR